MGLRQDSRQKTPLKKHIHVWLVVWPPLKNMKVSWDYYSQLSQYMEKKCSKPPTRCLNDCISKQKVLGNFQTFLVRESKLLKAKFDRYRFASLTEITSQQNTGGFVNPQTQPENWPFTSQEIHVDWDIITGGDLNTTLLICSKGSMFCLFPLEACLPHNFGESTRIFPSHLGPAKWRNPIAMVLAILWYWGYGFWIKAGLQASTWMTWMTWMTRALPECIQSRDQV